MELGTWRYLGEQTPRDQQHLTARCNTWFQSQPGRVGSGRGGGAAGKTLERAGLHQQQVSRLREKHLSGWLGWQPRISSAACRDGERAAENSTAEHPLQGGGEGSLGRRELKPGCFST